MKKCMGCMRDYNENYDKCPVCGYSTWNIEEDIRKKEDSLKAETILNARYIIGRVLSYTEYGITYLAWDALLQKKLLDAIAQSGRSYEEIMQYLQSPSEDV